MDRATKLAGGGANLGDHGGLGERIRDLLSDVHWSGRACGTVTHAPIRKRDLDRLDLDRLVLPSSACLDLLQDL